MALNIRLHLYLYFYVRYVTIKVRPLCSELQQYTILYCIRINL